MNESSIKKTLKKDWTLTAEAFRILLFSFDDNQEKASIIYEEIRKRLIRQFNANGSLIAEDQADDVFNRIARKIFEEGFILDRTNPYPYFHKTAHYVFLEYKRQSRRKFLRLEDLSSSEEPAYDPLEALKIADQRMQTKLGLRALKECRQKLSAKEFELLNKYDAIAGKDKRSQREQLANELGKSVNALKISISRIRYKLVNCLKKKINAPQQCAPYNNIPRR